MLHHTHLKCILLFLYCISFANLVSTCSYTGLDTNFTATARNPLRGLTPYPDYDDTALIPASMEFFESSLADLMTGPSTFTWTSVDDALDGAASRNRQLVLLFYVDYPGEPTGVPSYLFNAGCTNPCVTFTAYTIDETSGNSPNYSNPNLISAMKSFIAALGTRYDNDNRIAFIRVGMLGFWGEWHTYGCSACSFPYSTSQEILNAFNDAFKNTQLQVSADQLQYTNPALPMEDYPTIGWSDDAFMSSTCNGESWSFLERVKNQGYVERMASVSIGGEVLPSIQLELANTGTTSESTLNYVDCVKAVNATYMLYNDLFSVPYTITQQQRLLPGTNAMGYQFKISDITIVPREDCSGCAYLRIKVSNLGVARFFYELRMQIQVNGQPAQQGPEIGHQKGGVSKVYVVPIAWTSINNADLNVAISLHSNRVPSYLPISWANDGVAADGSKSFIFVQSCWASSASMLRYSILVIIQALMFTFLLY